VLQGAELRDQGLAAGCRAGEDEVPAVEDPRGDGVLLRRIEFDVAPLVEDLLYTLRDVEIGDLQLSSPRLP